MLAAFELTVRGGGGRDGGAPQDFRVGGVSGDVCGGDWGHGRGGGGGRRVRCGWVVEGGVFAEGTVRGVEVGGHM